MKTRTFSLQKKRKEKSMREYTSENSCPTFQTWITLKVMSLWTPCNKQMNKISELSQPISVKPKCKLFFCFASVKKHKRQPFEFKNYIIRPTSCRPNHSETRQLFNSSSPKHQTATQVISNARLFSAENTQE